MGLSSLQLNVQMTWIDFAIIGMYILLMLGVGYYIHRKAPNFDEYFIAGRAMTTPILICTLVSTYYGIDVLFGTSELAYNEGLVAFFGYSQPTYLFFIVAAFFFAKRLREAEFKSLPDVLERYYGRPAGLVGAVASFVYALPAVGLFGLGMVFHVIFGLDWRIGALVIGLVALGYTLMGGLWAVAITDTIQFVMMCVTLAIAIPLIMGSVGGLGELQETLPESYFEPLGGIPIGLVIIYAATGLAVLVDPAFYQRIFAAKDFTKVRNALLIGIVVWGAYDWCVTATGMLAAGAAQAGTIPLDTHPDTALLKIVVFALPAGLTGLFLAGVLSSEMSTIDSYCLVAGGNLVYDIYRPIFNPKASDEQLVRLTKWGIIVSWIVGYILALAFDRLLAMWVFMATLLTSTVLIPITVGLFYRGRKTRLAGLLGCSFGFLGSIIYYIILYACGTYDEEYATYIWNFTFGGSEFSIWQEYALFFTLPLSLAGFLLGNMIGRTVHQPPAEVRA
ncbi:MAG: sodium:solute symporter family protein [Acidobacteria bacterium]|nr:sodium:solute symporter family protein [Acidobacteriota bacterium]